MQPDDKFTTDVITRRLKGIFSGIMPGLDEATNVPTKRGVTKVAFDSKYRKWRKMRVKMQKRSRRINRARK